MHTAAAPWGSSGQRERRVGTVRARSPRHVVARSRRPGRRRSRFPAGPSAPVTPLPGYCSGQAGGFASPPCSGFALVKRGRVNLTGNAFAIVVGGRQLKSFLASHNNVKEHNARKTSTTFATCVPHVNFQCERCAHEESSARNHCTVLLATFEFVLSAPALVYARTAK